MDPKKPKPTTSNTPSIELRMSILSAIDHAQGELIRDRVKAVSKGIFTDIHSGRQYSFTWRTISTWLYRFKKHGVTTLDNKTRSDKTTTRKIHVNELADALHEILPTLSKNKVGVLPKITLYRQLLKHNYFQRSQLSQTSFYRFVNSIE